MWPDDTCAERAAAITGPTTPRMHNDTDDNARLSLTPQFVRKAW